VKYDHHCSCCLDRDSDLYYRYCTFAESDVPVDAESTGRRTERSNRPSNNNIKGAGNRKPNGAREILVEVDDDTKDDYPSSPQNIRATPVTVTTAIPTPGEIYDLHGQRVTPFLLEQLQEANLCLMSLPIRWTSYC
jgi:hypothetical protein